MKKSAAGAIAARVRDTIERYRMISPRDTVLAAVSGGPDSVAMLHLLLALRGDLGFEVKVAHLDHRFRGDESRADARFVSELCDRLGVLCVTEEVNVPQFLLGRRLSRQEAARMLRYQFLVKTSKLEYCQRIATGHNADDQAETVAMRLLRGAGPDGLAGIPPTRDGGLVIRPVLALWRSEIEGYLAENRLSCRVDASNADERYARNRIRHSLLPELRTYNPGIDRTLVGMSMIMTDIVDHLTRLTDETMPEVVEQARVGQFALDLARFESYDKALQRAILRRIFEVLRPDLAPLTFQHVENLLCLVRRGEVGRSVELPDGARARLEHGRLTISHGDGPPGIDERELPVPGSVSYPEADLDISARIVPATGSPARPADESEAFFDADSVREGLSVRARRQGDRIRPLGMEGTTSLKELFIDAKIPFSLRSSVPLLCHGPEIIWAVGLKRSAFAPVTEKTKRLLSVRVHRLEAHAESREDPSH